MPRTTGFEVLRSLPADVHRLHVVFVTGFAQHALAAFEIDVIAYTAEAGATGEAYAHGRTNLTPCAGIQERPASVTLT